MTNSSDSGFFDYYNTFRFDELRDSIMTSDKVFFSWGLHKINVLSPFQLRYLQTLNSISAEHNSTIIFPVPIDIVSNFMSFSQQNTQDGGGLDPQQQQHYKQFVEYQHQTMQAHHSMPQVPGYLDLVYNVIDIPLICTNTIYMEIPLSPFIWREG